KANTRGVLVIQIRDRAAGGWEAPYVSDNISDHAVKPFLLLQHNWFKMMEYFQNDMLTYYADNRSNLIHKIVFEYVADKEENKAALNFHLTRREEKDIMASINSTANQRNFQRLLELFGTKNALPAGITF